MDMMSYINTPSAWKLMKDALADYYAKQLDDEIDNLWRTGQLNEKKVAEFASLHERTPYK